MEFCGDQLDKWPVFANYTKRDTRLLNIKIVKRAGPDMFDGAEQAASARANSSSSSSGSITLTARQMPPLKLRLRVIVHGRTATDARARNLQMARGHSRMAPSTAITRRSRRLAS